MTRQAIERLAKAFIGVFVFVVLWIFCVMLGIWLLGALGWGRALSMIYATAVAVVLTRPVYRKIITHV